MQSSHQRYLQSLFVDCTYIVEFAQTFYPKALDGVFPLKIRLLAVVKWSVCMNAYLGRTTGHLNLLIAGDARKEENILSQGHPHPDKFASMHSTAWIDV